MQRKSASYSSLLYFAASPINARCTTLQILPIHALQPLHRLSTNPKINNPNSLLTNPTPHGWVRANKSSKYPSARKNATTGRSLSCRAQIRQQKSERNLQLNYAKTSLLQPFNQSKAANLDEKSKTAQDHTTRWNTWTHGPPNWSSHKTPESLIVVEFDAKSRAFLWAAILKWVLQGCQGLSPSQLIRLTKLLWTLLRGLHFFHRKLRAATWIWP